MDGFSGPTPAYWPRNAPPEPEVGGKLAVHIYQPSRSVMQGGMRRRDWILEFESTERPRIDPFMGWTGNADTRQQIQLRFPTVESALAFARRQGWRCDIRKPHWPRRRPKSYAENFRRSSHPSGSPV